MSPPSLREILHDDLKDQSKQEGGNKMQAAKSLKCTHCWLSISQVYENSKCWHSSHLLGCKQAKSADTHGWLYREKINSVEARCLLITWHPLLGLFICHSLANPVSNAITETMRQSVASQSCDWLLKIDSARGRRLWSLSSVFLITPSITGTASAHLDLMDGLHFISATWGEL